MYMYITLQIPFYCKKSNCESSWGAADRQHQPLEDFSQGPGYAPTAAMPLQNARRMTEITAFLENE